MVKPESPESGYASLANSQHGSPGASADSLSKINLTRAHLDHLNAQLERMHPKEILRFCLTFFPNLYQTTALGLTGLVTLDLLDQLQKEDPAAPHVDLIFLDTLYHFDETYDLLDRVRRRYAHGRLHVYKPHGVQSAAEYEAAYGEKLYENLPDLYDYTVKVEPLQRAYEELQVVAVLTGRRRSQGGARDKIPVLELDEERNIVKINPLVTWSFPQVQAYIKEHDVPYNALLDRGYKSIGDWHSTSPVREGEDERAGRWRGQAKSECGIHQTKSHYTNILRDLQSQPSTSTTATTTTTTVSTPSKTQVAQQQPVMAT